VSEDVTFYTHAGWRRVQRFDRSLLRLGRVLFLDESGGTPGAGASLAPFANARPHVVAWIAPSDWSVLLEPGRAPDMRTVERLCELLPGTHRERVEAALAEAAADIRLERQYVTGEYRRSRLHSVEAVLERLDLVERLSAGEVGRALFHHWEPLVVYLLLTCFDLLGQPASWLTFGAWLTSKRTAAERELASEGAAGPATAQALHLHEAYTARYGVRVAFLRFIREVLAPDDRRALLDSLSFHRSSNPPELTAFGDLDDDGKEKYLFEIRNSYTHRAQFSPGLHDAVLPDDDAMQISQVVREQWVDARTWTSVNTARWPSALRAAVVAGLAQYLRSLTPDSTETDTPRP
jgi:hypothetical protein